MLVSIIIPAFNEQSHIRETLKRCVALSYPKKEIIVVNDGSTDNTPNIVKEYERDGVILINQENKGRCSARNRGILAAKGEILVFLDADVLLEPDFIDRILPHYEKGADYVLVDTDFIDKKYVFVRFDSALHHYNYDKRKDIEWTQAFSCRKKAALDVGMFREDAPIPLVGGEDSYLGKKLKEKGYKKVIDRSIIVFHISPKNIKEFWKNRKEASYYYMSYFVEKIPLPKLFLRAFLRTVLISFQIFFLIPCLFASYRISRFSKRKTKDFFPFFFVFILQQAAFVFGKWQSLFKIMSLRKFSRK